MKLHAVKNTHYTKTILHSNMVLTRTTTTINEKDMLLFNGSADRWTVTNVGGSRTCYFSTSRAMGKLGQKCESKLKTGILTHQYGPYLSLCRNDASHAIPNFNIIWKIEIIHTNFDNSEFAIIWSRSLSKEYWGKYQHVIKYDYDMLQRITHTSAFSIHQQGYSASCA